MLLELKIGKSEGDKLRYPEAATIRYFQHRSVANTCRFLGVGLAQNVFNFLKA
tara:strand:- start:120 stop:278 length:159 start_codon:yes stop_codon:yes gene_type:complete